MTDEQTDEQTEVVGLETISPANPVDLRSCVRGIWYFVFSVVYGLHFATLKAEGSTIEEPPFRMMLKIPSEVSWCPLSAPVDAVSVALFPLTMEDHEIIERFYKGAYAYPQQVDYFVFEENLLNQIQKVFDKYYEKEGMEEWRKQHKKQPLVAWVLTKSP